MSLVMMILFNVLINGNYIGGLKVIIAILFLMKLELLEEIIKKYNKKINQIYFKILNLNLFVFFVQIILINFFKKSYLLPWQSIDLKRGMGLFCEPSHFATYIMLILIQKSKLNLKRVILLSIVLILMKSFVGYIVLLFILFKYILEKIKKRDFIIIFIPILLLSNVVFNYLKTDERLIKIKNSKDISTILRVNKGFRVFTKLPISKKIIGVGIENDKENKYYAQKTNYEKIQAYEDAYYYYNGIFKEIIEMGIIVGILLNVYYYKVFGSNNLYFFICFEIMRLGGGLNIRSLYLFFIIVLINSNKEICKGEITWRRKSASL
ncbi:MAG: hypothetical protein SOR81_08545 [Fusobacterium sp.]|uniref:hypothetical protein n=1 Tax=Fusobacterium sp. TaxID=68766 RepID=UPI002A757152|nr:hypothetical protein [Fusobacterium sp.]MDY2981633.1 hypothetical protein [Fusobacterium sp.]